MPKQKLILTALLTFFVCCPMLVRAQELHATINGLVTDASGAVVPNAQVTIARTDVKGETRTIDTNAAGSYTATDLAAGRYNITVSANGFKTFTSPDVTVFVAQTRAVNAKLQPGAVSQTVTVQQSSVAIDTTTSALAGTISGTQVRELQLNNRNFEQLVTLQPGVVSNLPSYVGFGLSNTTALSVNGNRETANNWTVDGADINDSGSNATLLNVPSVDAIQEFTLERSMYDAGFGRSGGGQVLVSTKSGTSAFHGDLYEFNRNNAYNANTYFNNLVGLPIAIERYNDYGFTLGGPLYIPKVYNTAKDKTFFFWSEEWRKVSLPVTSTLLTPTADQLRGIATGDVTNAPPGCVTYNAATNQSTINPACYSQNAKVYLANIYDKNPANTGTNLETVTYSQLNNTREDLVRFDYNINQKLHFFGRAMQDETPENFPEGLFAGTNFLGVAGSSVNAPGENVVGNLTWTISPRMVNEAEFAYSQGEISASFFPGAAIDSAAFKNQLTNNTAYTDPYGRNPNISFTGGIIQGVGSGVDPYTERNLDKNFFDNFSATIGKHTLRAGGTVSFMLKTENASNGAANFRFNSFHDFLLGNALQYNQASRDIIPDLHYYNIEGYVQDDWQASPKLTLNLGLRYSYFPSPGDVNNTLNNFDPLLFNPANAPAIDPVSGNFTAASGQVPATYVNGLIFPAGSACAQAQAIAPKITCSPYGSHVNPDPKKNFAPRIGFAYVPHADGKMAIRGGFGIFYDRMLNGIWEQNAFQDPPLVQTSTVNNTQFDKPLAGTSSVSLAPNHIVSTGSPTMKNPSYIDYNLSIQQQVLPNTVAELAYVGDQGRHLLGERDINQPTIAERQANPTAYVTAVVPYLGYNWFADRIPEYMSNYNSLQLSVQHRTEKGLTIGVAYTWSRTLTNQSNDRGSETYDTYNIAKDYGPAFFNQPQTFITNYVYDLPFFQAQHGIVGHLLGGWEASGIVNFQSGQSLTITQALDNFDCQTPTGGTGCIANTYPGGLNMDVSDIAPRPDRVAPIHMTKKRTQWFSTNSFADAIGHFGTSGSGVLLGPGIINFDMAAMKNFNFGRRASFQFRTEFFNAFNHTNFNAVDTGRDDATFGQVLSAHSPREIQFGGKFYF